MAFAGMDYQADGYPRSIELFEGETSYKLTRGVTNAIFGWTELFWVPIHMGDSYRYNFFEAVTLGIPQGIARTVGRTLVGVYEVATFYAPQKPIFPELRSVE